MSTGPWMGTFYAQSVSSKLIIMSDANTVQQEHFVSVEHAFYTHWSVLALRGEVTQSSDRFS